jgi:hypothetical protein
MSLNGMKKRKVNPGKAEIDQDPKHLCEASKICTKVD